MIKEFFKDFYVSLIIQREVFKLNKKRFYVESKFIVKALKSTLNRRIDSEEKVWIDKIESLRNQLNQSSTELLICYSKPQSSNHQLNTEKPGQYNATTKSISEISKISSKRSIWALLLFRLIREFKPSTCLELGTCLGVSASYQAAALELNEWGRLLTLEGAESLANEAQNNLKSLGLKNAEVVLGLFQDTLSKVLLEQSPIDFVFIDGHHDERATLIYFDQIFPFLSNNAICVFDDIAWSSGMKRAWKTLVADKRIKFAVDLFNIGICVVSN